MDLPGRLERRYGDYTVTATCYAGNHGECQDRACECWCHPLTLRERVHVARAWLRRRFTV